MIFLSIFVYWIHKFWLELSLTIQLQIDVFKLQIDVVLRYSNKFRQLSSIFNALIIFKFTKEIIFSNEILKKYINFEIIMKRHEDGKRLL